MPNRRLSALRTSAWVRRCGGPEQVAQIEIHPSVGPKDARNAEKQIAVGVSALCAGDLSVRAQVDWTSIGPKHAICVETARQGVRALRPYQKLLGRVFEPCGLNQTCRAYAGSRRGAVRYAKHITSRQRQQGLLALSAGYFPTIGSARLLSHCVSLAETKVVCDVPNTVVCVARAGEGFRMTSVGSTMACG